MIPAIVQLPFEHPEPDITLRIGCELVYETSMTTPSMMVLRPRRMPSHRIESEILKFHPSLVAHEEIDSHGNVVDRVMLKPGRNVIQHDALVAVTSEYENTRLRDEYLPVDRLPVSILRYTLPSRYCDSDKLMDFAWQHFSQYRQGAERVQAICDWLHNNIEYRFGSGRPDISASEIIARGFGVCRDFAHTAVALCRTFNIPARYVTGYLPDIGFVDEGSPMDFHAYLDVFLGHWYTFDARFNQPRIGRVNIACGMDAVDAAFSTIYGEARLTKFEVWAYQVDPNEVSVGDPIDISKRLDGTVVVRRF